MRRNRRNSACVIAFGVLTLWAAASVRAQEEPSRDAGADTGTDTDADTGTDTDTDTDAGTGTDTDAV